jgi:diphosphomevalonate decarboxylase
MDYTNSRLVIETTKIEAGAISWRSPSNIALIKYWGKHGRQLPQNPSISFTLDQAFSETILEYTPKTGADQGIELEFLFEGQRNETFEQKVHKFLESITDIFPFLRQLKLRIKSSNSFPHSAGIASSASGMSALALCLCSLEYELFGTLENDQAFRQKASYVARLGSGSACRSIYATAAVWGQTNEIETASDLYAIPVGDQLHPVFQQFHDDILIVAKSEKKVSSRAGHGLMENNVYAEDRYRQARQRFRQLYGAMKSGDLETFGRITEAEALTLHAMMMAGPTPYLLLQPHTISIIQRLQSFRAASSVPVYFSLDAGPNPHLLYPDSAAKEVQQFIRGELSQWCEDWIEDQVGPGPLQLDVD